MNAVFFVLFGLVLCFGFVLLFGAPYLPTLSKQVDEALDMIDLAPGQTLLELGCGDGKVMIAAAARGWNVIGYELNPLLAFVAWLRTLKYRGQTHARQGTAKVVCGNFWNKKWPPADGIFVFLLDKYMSKLDTKITQDVVSPIKVISFVFKIPAKQPAIEHKGLYLYEYTGRDRSPSLHHQ